MPGGESFHDGAGDPSRISTRQDFAAELTLLRERAGLTVRDVATELGIPASTIGGYFGGRHLPPVRLSYLLTQILSVCGVYDAAEIERWLAALARVRRAPGRRPADAPIPYRGLKSFQPEDADWFYGRQRLTDILVLNLREIADRGGLLAVVGPSGSGKSSLLRAGLVPALRSGALNIPCSHNWPLILLTPGAQPMRELEQRMTAVTGDDHGHVVIVVDQFEEIFTTCQDEQERLAFITALSEAGDSRLAALAVLGLRADFYPHALRYPQLVCALQSRQVLVGPMTEEELRSAITGPARKAGLEIEDGLVEVLLRDLAPATDHHTPPAAHDPGTLPLLSHALLTAWKLSRGGRLTVADYRRSGGIHGAVAASAEEVYTGLTLARQDLARRVFTRLVRVADDAADTRRRVPRAELLVDGDVGPVLDAFIENRLITAGIDDVEIAHEALLWAWPRLRQWIDSDSLGARTHRQLMAAAEAWRDSGRDPGALYGGARLAAAEEWTALSPRADDLNMLEREFLEASIGQRRAAEEAARRRTRRLRVFVGAFAALFLVAGTLAALAYQQKNAATYQQELAISRQVATDADELQASDIALAMQLSLAAYQISPTAEALSSLLDSTASVAATRMIGPTGTEVNCTAFSPSGTVLTTGSDTGTVRLWNVSRPGRPVPYETPLDVPGAVTSLAFSPDSKVLVIASTGGPPSLWNVGNARRPVLLGRIPAGSAAVVNSVAYSPDGLTLATASADGRIYLWDVTDPRHVLPLGAPLNAGTGQVNSVAFSPNSAILAAGGADGRIRLWDLTKPIGSALKVGAFLQGPAHGVNVIAFSPDSRTLAAAGNDSRIWLWTTSPARRTVSERPPLTGARSWIYSLAFSPDGSSIAAGSADNNAYIWNLPSGALIATLPHPAPVLSVAYGAGGTLATGDADGIARIWTLPGPIVAGAQGSVFTVAFSPEGNNLAVGSATASGNGAVQLWGTGRPDRPTALGTPLTAAGKLDGTVAYGPGGRLAAGAGDGSVYLWDAKDPRHPVSLPTPQTALRSAIQSVTFDETGRLMAAGSTTGAIGLWNTADLARTQPLAVLPAITKAAYRDVFAVAFSPDSRLLASASADGTVRLWNISDPARPRLGQTLTRLARAVYQVTFSPDGHLLAATGADGKVRLWDVTDPREPRLLTTLSGAVGIIYDVAFSPDGHTLATADGDKTVSLWNIADPSRPNSLGSLTGPAGTVFSVAFSPDGNTLAAGSQDGTTRLWIATPASAATYVCAIAGDPITRAEWTQYIPELPYNPPCEKGH